MALVRLPYMYEVELYPPRCRTSTKHTVRDMATFDLPEVSSAEAPVSAVAEFDEPVPGGCGARRSRRATYRVHGGRTFGPADRVNDRGVPLARFEADYASPPDVEWP